MHRNAAAVRLADPAFAMPARQCRLSRRGPLEQRAQRVDLAFPAERLGDLSGGDDMVISDDVYRDDAVEKLLGDWGATASAFDAQVRGIQEPRSVWRIEF